MLVETLCGRLFVEVSGQGPDLVLWPSLLCDGGMWRHQVPALRERFRVIDVDPPGHGRSGPVRHRYTLDDCVKAATTVLDAAGAERAAWCGLSWGGMVGMRLAARQPERVRSLVLMDTSAERESRRKLPEYRVLQLLVRTFGPSRLLARRTIPIMFAHPDRHPDEMERYLDRLVRMDPMSIVHAVDAVLFHRDDVTAELSRIEAPTLVLVGEHDTATSPERAEHLARQIRGAELLRVPEAGHLSTLENPAFVTDALLRFLSETTSR